MKYFERESSIVNRERCSHYFLNILQSCHPDVRRDLRLRIKESILVKIIVEQTLIIR